MTLQLAKVCISFCCSSWCCQLWENAQLFTADPYLISLDKVGGDPEF